MLLFLNVLEGDCFLNYILFYILGIIFLFSLCFCCCCFCFCFWCFCCFLLSFNVFLLLCCICPSFCFYIYFAVVAAWLRFVSFWLLSLLVLSFFSLKFLCVRFFILLLLPDFINKSETPVPLHASHQKFYDFTPEPETFVSLRPPKNYKHKTPKKWTSGLRTPKKSELKKDKFTPSL